MVPAVSSVVMLISSGSLSSWMASPDSSKCLSFSSESLALETSSRIKISLSV
jgi:hypothetical protein